MTKFANPYRKITLLFIFIALCVFLIYQFDLEHFFEGKKKIYISIDNTIKTKHQGVIELKLYEGEFVELRYKGVKEKLYPNQEMEKLNVITLDSLTDFFRRTSLKNLDQYRFFLIDKGNYNSIVPVTPIYRLDD